MRRSDRYRDWRQVGTALYSPQTGVHGPWTRPPLGSPLAGRRSTSGGRGHRALASDDWRAWRTGMAYRAWRLRCEAGWDLSRIAATLGISRAVVGRWLYGCPGARGLNPLTVRELARAVDPVDWRTLPLAELLATIQPRPVLPERPLSPRLTAHERMVRSLTR